MASVLIIGCGYIGLRVAKREMTAGREVRGLVRTDPSAADLESLGVAPLLCDLDEPASLEALSVKGQIVYYFAPPPSAGETDPRMENFLSAISEKDLPERVVLISTTGIYGDCKGEWVTEERPPAPEADRAKRRLSAETSLITWGEKNSVPVVILRVPGIYGPGRLPEKRLRDGVPVLNEAESPFSNRIHADDLARVCLAAGRADAPVGIFNVSDGHPTSMTDYFFRVADLLGIPRPPTVSMEEAQRLFGPGMLSYLAESKKIDNRRMREVLDVEPDYPDLESGLKACLEE